MNRLPLLEQRIRERIQQAMDEMFLRSSILTQSDNSLNGKLVSIRMRPQSMQMQTNSLDTEVRLESEVISMNIMQFKDFENRLNR